MSKTCYLCHVAAPEGVTFSYCSACQSVMYCSKVCQKKDWKAHKKICKSLNAGDGAMQVRNNFHEKASAKKEELFREMERNLGKDGKRFFKYFTQSTFKGSQAEARKMKKIVIRETRHSREVLLGHSLNLLLHTDSEKLLWPNSPLLVLLQFVDPNALTGPDHEALQEGETRVTLLHLLTYLTDPIGSDYVTQENQVILGGQLIEHGANVNAGSYSNGVTPLHHACHSSTTTNLDFIQLLLENGADPNTRDPKGMTPLMYTIKMAPGAAKFLLEWPTTNVNIVDRSGISFPAYVREVIEILSGLVALPVNANRAENQFLYQQWCEIEKILVEREAVDTGMTGL
jgi:hypothetical protein